MELHNAGRLRDRCQTYYSILRRMGSIGGGAAGKRSGRTAYLFMSYSRDSTLAHFDEAF